KHFAVNQMIQRDSVKQRFEAREEGISYTEFSYMLLQAYDFLELYRRHGVKLQVGGSDQWGNITAGVELIRRCLGGEAHAITFPLVMTAAGTKFGKTADGAIWLDPALTSPYRFYQFWINVDDRDVPLYLRYFTLLTHQEIGELDRAVAEHPESRDAQRALAADMTARVHGGRAANAAREMSAVLFGEAEPATLSSGALEAMRREIPYAEAPVPAPVTVRSVLDIMTGGAVSLFKSKADAKRMVEQGGVSVNGCRVSDANESIALLHGKYALVRKGAKTFSLAGFV
ncbi:MAG TPA: tyrosine--tRNA ligase, partial [Gemmatimonadaceae bacterium]|nr:tyrosine--tRNA ligase [Gemmatimonadaceae bacterium]